MKDKEFLSKLRERQVEVSQIPTQDLGALTPVYRSFTPYLKKAPWKAIILIGIVLVFLIRLALGNSFVHIASILQEGF